MQVDDFHSDLRTVARLLPRGGIGPRTLRPLRALTTIAGGRGRRGKHVDVVTLGPVSIRVHHPSTMPNSGAALLWIHGGGYVFGTAQQDDSICRHFAQELGITVAAVDYRLAPEYPFPLPLNDCFEALLLLASLRGVDPSRLAIGGASAGAGLAASLALMARERAEVRIAFQLLSYPMLDDRSAVRADVDETRFRLWNRKSNYFGWSAYTGKTPGSEGIDPWAAPSRVDDLTGLPPAWIGVGTLDLFHDEDVTYARRLQECGVACELAIVEGAFHGFDLVVPRADVSRDFRTAQVKALAAAL